MFTMTGTRTIFKKPLAAFWLVLGIIFMTEFILMIVLDVLQIDAPRWAVALIDASTLSLTVAGVIMWALLRTQQPAPGEESHAVQEAPVDALMPGNIINPWKIFGQILGVILVSITSMLLLFELQQIRQHQWHEVLFHVLVATLPIVGAAWWLVVRPLKHRLRHAVTRSIHTEYALHEREAQHKAVIDSALDAIIVNDAQGRITEFNPAAERVFGYRRAEVVGADFADLLIPGSENGRLRRKFRENLNRGEPPFQSRRVEVNALHSGGHEFPVELSVQRIDGDGNLYFTAFLRDITERKQIEEALLLVNARLDQLNRLLDEANRAKSQFLANMSHELRTPLNAIIGYSEILAEDAVQTGVGSRLTDLEKIKNAGQHLLGLIDDVLDLSGIEAGRMGLDIETFPVVRLVNEVVMAVTPLIEKNGNIFKVDCPENTGVMTSDLTKVRQILFNLLRNAARFTDNGTVSLAVARLDMDNAEEGITFIVGDTGIGMSDDQMAVLFQPFMQADGSATRKYGGAGLGLAITRRYCTLLGGEVRVQSSPGQGSQFTVCLPARLTITSGPDRFPTGAGDLRCRHIDRSKSAYGKSAP